MTFSNQICFTQKYTKSANQLNQGVDIVSIVGIVYYLLTGGENSAATILVYHALFSFCRYFYFPGICTNKLNKQWMILYIVSLVRQTLGNLISRMTFSFICFLQKSLVSRLILFCFFLSTDFHLLSARCPIPYFL